jgi:hypothetical protein
MNTSRPSTLDCAPIEALAVEFLKSIKAHYLRRPTSRDSVFEVLNALAAAAAEVIDGTEGEGREFFDKALAQALEAK